VIVRRAMATIGLALAACTSLPAATVAHGPAVITKTTVATAPPPHASTSADAIDDDDDAPIVPLPLPPTEAEVKRPAAPAAYEAAVEIADKLADGFGCEKDDRTMRWFDDDRALALYKDGSILQCVVFLVANSKDVLVAHGSNVELITMHSAAGNEWTIARDSEHPLIFRGFVFEKGAWKEKPIPAAMEKELQSPPYTIGE
jgi:hypothetical protein